MRLRIRYGKEGKIRFVGHRDVARIWERTLRRAGLRLAYSEGFSPRPKVHFGLALPTSFESDAEYLDIDLAEPLVIDEELVERIAAALPPGMAVQQVVEITREVPSLQHDVVEVVWATRLEGIDRDALHTVLTEALAASALPYERERKGKVVEDDFRPYLLTAGLVDDAERVLPEPAEPHPHPMRGVEFHCRLAAQPRAPRPTELLSALGVGAEPTAIRRLAQYTSIGGAPEERTGRDPTRRDEPHDRRQGRHVDGSVDHPPGPPGPGAEEAEQPEQPERPEAGEDGRGQLLGV